MRDPERYLALLAAVWLGGLVTVAAVATPAAFAALSPEDAGRVAGRILAREAASSLVMGALMLALHRWRARTLDGGVSRGRFDATLALAAGAVFCTLVGYYAIQPMMAEARAGQGDLSFGQLHAISVAFFAVKLVLVATLAVRLNLRLNPKPNA